MGCGCGGRTYARPAGSAQPVSQHAPQTRMVSTRQTHVPQNVTPKVLQSSALARRNAPVRRQV